MEIVKSDPPGSKTNHQVRQLFQFGSAVLKRSLAGESAYYYNPIESNTEIQKLQCLEFKFSAQWTQVHTARALRLLTKTPALHPSCRVGPKSARPAPYIESPSFSEGHIAGNYYLGISSLLKNKITFANNGIRLSIYLGTPF